MSDTTTPPDQQVTEEVFEPDRSGLSKKDRNLLDRLAIAGYTPEGSDAPLFSRQYERLLEKAQRRGLDTTGVEGRYSSLAEVASALPAGASGKRQRIAERVEIEELEEEKRRRDESIKLAQESLDAFMADNSYENLLESIRTLPATLSDDDVATLKRQTVQRARDDEVARLRRVGATVGVRGLVGGGAAAALAEQAAREADRQITLAFNQIAMEKISRDRQDILEAAQMETELLNRRQSARLQLEQNLRGAREGFMTTTQPLHNYSAFVEAQRARQVQEELARERNRNELVGAGLSAGGQIGGAILETIPFL